MVTYVRLEHGLSLRRACHAFGLSRSVYGYQPKDPDDGLVIEALVGLAEKFPRYGFGKLFSLVRRQQPTWNHKRVYRVYCALKLNLRRKGKKRLPSRHPEKIVVPAAANVCWSVDFMSDVLMSGQRFRTFNVLDDFNREVLAIEVDTPCPPPGSSVCWIGWWLGEDALRSFAWTTDRNSYPWRWRIGPRSTA